MSLNIQNNVAMPQNQMAFKGGKFNFLNAIKSIEEKGGKFPSLVSQPYTPQPYKRSERASQLAREEFINSMASYLESIENSEVGKALKSIADRFNKKEITAEEAEMMIKKQLELIG